jgi:hypothetical protein
MGLEYVGVLLPDGHLSVNQSVLSKIREGEQLKITVEPLSNDSQGKFRGKTKMDSATQRFLARLEEAPKLGQIKGELSREAIYENRADENF